MASFFNFAAQPVEVEIKLTGEAERKQVEVKGEKEKKERCPVYYDGESVIGQVSRVMPMFELSGGRKWPYIAGKLLLILCIGDSESQGRAEVSARRDPHRAHRINR